ITMLPDSYEVEEVILGEKGVIEGIKPDSIVIDMSSIDPKTTVKIGYALEKKNVEMLDAPVSGGEEGAIKGELSIMVGGKKEIFERCLPIFQSMGKNITYIGPLGSGQMTKLVNQIIVAINIAGICEAFSLGKKAGLSVETIFNAVRGGLAGSKVMDTKIPRFIERNFEPGFKLDLHIKDLKNALLIGKELKIPLPFTSLVNQIMISISGKSEGDKDHSILVRFWEELLNLEVK
ncbi:MAG: NAD-binding protein, partial [Dictyoglomaceae bacterium]|nr:NAD-binding protein [Dictyoglomaceae bacterium]